MVNRWWLYSKERFPFSTYGFLTAGLTCSGQLLATGTLSFFSFFLTWMGTLLFFAELRLMDEKKDFSKDQEAHPQRPLPRGLLSLSEASWAISILATLMLLLSLFTGFFLSSSSGLCYCFTTIYLWLMYREFYCAPSLSKSPLLYACSHQVILFPLALFCIASADPSRLFHPSSWWWATTLLGAFFAYEVCRKLDPQAHPILLTYPQVYGSKGSALIALGCVLLSSLGAYFLCMHTFLWPLHGVLLLGLGYYVMRPTGFRWIEHLFTLSLALHLWSIVLQFLIVGINP